MYESIQKGREERPSLRFWTQENSGFKCIYTDIYTYTATHTYMYLCICISIYVYAHIYVWIHPEGMRRQDRSCAFEHRKTVDLNAYTQIYIHIQLHTHICIYVYVYLYMYMYIYMYESIQKGWEERPSLRFWTQANSGFKCIYTDIYTYTATHTYMYIYISIYVYV